MFLLDTNVISELRKARAGKCDPNVLNWAAGIDARLMFLSVITIHEIEIGTLRLLRRDPLQGAIYQAWLENDVLVSFSDRILPIDLEASRKSAALHVPDPAPDRDAFIAATALVHGMTIVTRNTGDFVRTGVPAINPWLAH